LFIDPDHGCSGGSMDAGVNVGNTNIHKARSNAFEC